MININDLEKYAVLKLEIFTKQPRQILSEIKTELSELNPAMSLDACERYLIYYAMIEKVLSTMTREFIIDVLVKADKKEKSYTLIYKMKYLDFPTNILVDVCVDILKGK